MEVGGLFVHPFGNMSVELPKVCEYVPPSKFPLVIWRAEAAWSYTKNKLAIRTHRLMNDRTKTSSAF